MGWAAKRWIFTPVPHKQQICYSFISKDLVSPGFFEIPGLEIAVNGAKQVRVAVVNLCVWNQGSKVVRDGDWAPKGPLSLSIPKSCQVLAVQRTAESNVACNFQFHEIKSGDTQTIKLAFDFFGKDDGAVLQIVHTGSPLDSDLVLSGTLVDGEKIQRVEAEPLLFKSKLKTWSDIPAKRRITVYGVAFLFTTVLFYGVFTVFLSMSPTVAGLSAVAGSGGLTLSDLVRDAFRSWRLKGQPRLTPVLRDGLLGIKHQPPKQHLGRDTTWTL